MPLENSVKKSSDGEADDEADHAGDQGALEDRGRQALPHHPGQQRDGESGKSEAGGNGHGERTIHVHQVDIVRMDDIFSVFPDELGKLALTIHQSAGKPLEETDTLRLGPGSGLRGTSIRAAVQSMGQSVQGLGGR